MTELNMVDHLGFGIGMIHRTQKQRFLPLPDFDLSDSEAVKVTIYGAEIDKNYTNLLMSQTELGLVDVLALDRVQKKQEISSETAQRLRRAKLIEGRKPNYRVSALVAEATNSKAEYIRNRSLDDTHYRQLITEMLSQFGSASRADINKLLWDKLGDHLDETQKRNKITNLLGKMRKEGVIFNAGTRRHPRWQLT